MVVIGPSKVIAEPVSRVKVDQAPNGSVGMEASRRIAPLLLRTALGDRGADVPIGMLRLSGSTTVDPLSNVTAVIARALPVTVESWPNVIAEPARMLPAMEDDKPIVAAVPSAQTVFDGCAPFVNSIEVEVAVMRVEAAWKIH